VAALSNSYELVPGPTRCVLVDVANIHLSAYQGYVPAHDFDHFRTFLCD